MTRPLTLPAAKTRARRRPLTALSSTPVSRRATNASAAASSAESQRVIRISAISCAAAIRARPVVARNTSMFSSLLLLRLPPALVAL